MRVLMIGAAACAAQTISIQKTVAGHTSSESISYLCIQISSLIYTSDHMPTLVVFTLTSSCCCSCNLYIFIRSSSTSAHVFLFFWWTYKPHGGIWGSRHHRVRLRGRGAHWGAPTPTPSNRHWYYQWQWRSRSGPSSTSYFSFSMPQSATTACRALV